MTWEWVNNPNFFFLGWTIPLLQVWLATIINIRIKHFWKWHLILIPVVFWWILRTCRWHTHWWLQSVGGAAVLLVWQQNSADCPTASLPRPPCRTKTKDSARMLIISCSCWFISTKQHWQAQYKFSTETNSLCRNKRTLEAWWRHTHTLCSSWEVITGGAPGTGVGTLSDTELVCGGREFTVRLDCYTAFKPFG